MMDEMRGFSTIEMVRRIQPVIHCITNYVTANDVANMVLAAGASPIMADHAAEAEDIAAVSQGLVLNLGTLREGALDAMLLAGRAGARLGHPIVLDPVGAAAAVRRREAAERILTEIPCTVIRGNASEIRAVAWMVTGEKERSFDSCGVDADAGSRLTQDNRQETIRLMQALSRCTGAVVVMTGETDVAVDKDRVCLVKNGCPMLRQITGSGCMMDGILAAFLAAGNGNADRDIFWSTAYAVAAAGICGELAYEKTMQAGGGTASFRMHFIDAMSLLTDQIIERRIRIEL